MQGEGRNMLKWASRWRAALATCWGRLLGREPEWVRAVRAADAAFDGQHGVQTGGIVELGGLAVVGPHRQHGVSHVASLPQEFDAAFDDLPVSVAGHTFVDMGCGRGRALLLAARRSFSALVGVEFAPALLADARRNTAGVTLPLALHCADAAAFELPGGPLVIYLYNPFGAPVMDAVARRAAAAHGPVHVVYINPFHEASWHAAGFRTVARGATHAILTR
jgi:SAM-dependent methyltransferase